jgi:uncharacterized protein YhhL (DUF1145 family)
MFADVSLYDRCFKFWYALLLAVVQAYADFSLCTVQAAVLYLCHALRLLLSKDASCIVLYTDVHEWTPVIYMGASI